jgi:aryl-alcohol dehydrogenase-like predicted oxidoreductase
MTKVCTHGRGKREAMRQLEQSLRRLKTDRLDLWQVHECVYDNDPDLHFASGGVIEALDQAQRQGRSASSASPATSIPTFTCPCGSATTSSTRASFP